MCTTKGIRIYDHEEDQIYSETFRQWCRKLQTLNAKQFKAGIELLEYRQGQAYNLGEEMWPPSYAQFKAMCLEGYGTQCHRRFTFQALPDITSRERAQKAGERELDKMREMFDL